MSNLSPGTPASALPQTEHIYRLFFAFGNNPRAELIFKYDKPLQDAINRGREQCSKMNYRFIRVEEFLVDLNAREKSMVSD